MARYIGPVCRLCRREAMKLFLKGERCYTEKCAIEKRNFPPGQHGKTRTEISDLFSQNKRSGEIAQALELLLAAGKARFLKIVQPPGQRGRPVEMWFAI